MFTDVDCCFSFLIGKERHMNDPCFKKIEGKEREEQEKIN